MYCNKNKINWDDFNELRECVKSLVKEKRYIHTLGVEEETVKIAEIYKYDADSVKKLRSAAILHDITKEFDREKQLEICAKYNIKLTKDDMRVEKEWHAKTAAYIAKYEFGAGDIVFDAVYNHTLGCTAGTPLSDMIVYLADYIEPYRTYGDCVEVREFFYSRIKKAESLEEKYMAFDETILFSLNKTINAVINDNSFIHKNSVKYRNSFVIRLQKN